MSSRSWIWLNALSTQIPLPIFGLGDWFLLLTRISRQIFEPSFAARVRKFSLHRFLFEAWVSSHTVGESIHIFDLLLTPTPNFDQRAHKLIMGEPHFAPNVSFGVFSLDALVTSKTIGFALHSFAMSAGVSQKLVF